MTEINKLERIKLNFSKIISYKFKKLKNNDFKVYLVRYQNISIDHRIILEREIVEFEDIIRRICVEFTEFK
jgi:hypothetical protein